MSNINNIKLAIASLDNALLTITKNSNDITVNGVADVLANHINTQPYGLRYVATTLNNDLLLIEIVKRLDATVSTIRQQQTTQEAIKIVLDDVTRYIKTITFTYIK